MTVLAPLAVSGLLRAPGRTAVRALALAAAVALLGAMLLFVGHSLRTMTGSAARSVPVDWQVQLAPGTDLAAAERTIAAAPGVASTAPVGSSFWRRKFLASSHVSVQATRWAPSAFPVNSRSSSRSETARPGSSVTNTILNRDKKST